ncbi:hypothetical protein W97_01910 [Coniosporium apollinis CBS 100218]|uniref:TatD DNase n=1 Tax=Coniosporium apollinis (strain CBS 100218) TaxID=1168221 RepID=R7YM36_CONA1|nr:uncharacterized protein W97_01910 [Coniosporium apollinis CBS 100218]EON62686.1 hypothetical protein W97_01910 [Coniosporium apollinis CBS 100218]
MSSTAPSSNASTSAPTPTTAASTPSNPLLVGLEAVDNPDDPGAKKQLRYVDIGVNLGDPVYRGQYHGKKVHEDDLADVVQRALEAGCRKMMVTGSDLKESEHAIQIAREFPGLCYATIGVHPCSAHQFDTHPGGPTALLAALKDLALSSSAAGKTAGPGAPAVAFGEIGLDYDRLFLCPKETQLKYFEAQLDLAVELQLPLFLHSRAAATDFEALLTPRLPHLPKRGLVHSFTGTLEEMQRLISLGLDIGVNGCSFKTPENLDVVREIPLERLQIETDGPWCEMRASHASAKYLEGFVPAAEGKAVKKEKWSKGATVRGRNEPASIAAVAWVVAGVKGVGVEVVAEAAWRNSVEMFGLGEGGG